MIMSAIYVYIKRRWRFLIHTKFENLKNTFINQPLQESPLHAPLLQYLNGL